MIRGITFSEQAFYSADFAHYQNFFLNGRSGITKGCQVTHSGGTVTIGTGFFIACGRMLCVEEAETVEAAQGFAEGYNRIVYEIDLSKENTIEEFRQGKIKVLDDAGLVQEDLDAGGHVYQMPFCHFQWDGAAVSGFAIDAPTLVLDNIFADVSANFEAVNQQFMQWFDGKKAVVSGMVEELESEGFEKAAVKTAMTLAAGNWDAESKTYSFEEAYPQSAYDVGIEPVDCTAEQAEAWGAMVPMGSSAENVLTALGEVPLVDIPVLLSVRRKQEVSNA